MNQKLTEKEFITKAIKTLRKPPYKGIHVVYSGLNQAFREYFPGQSPVEAIAKLEQDGIVAVKPVKGGVMIYLAEDQPEPQPSVLGRILAGGNL